MIRRSSSMLGLLVLIILCNPVQAQQFTLEKKDDGITVNVDGKLFTRYLVQSGAKPILWPVVGPTGKEMTRAYPMREAGPKEANDHVHQRSLWFTHGDVNGISFWDEEENHGTILHREFVKAEAGTGHAIIVTRNDWVSPGGKRVCEDERKLVFGVGKDLRWIDFDVTVTAGDEPVTFGDTKEGSFGVRVAGSMDVQRKEGGKIINSEGQTDDEAWGKRAPWVDYSGPVDDEVLGIAILNHPSSFRYPTYWHVRPYGLFAANPFGWHDFLGDANTNGAHTLQPKESFTLRYRVLLHRGRADEANVAEQFEHYSQ
jgi:hypothetical protein